MVGAIAAPWALLVAIGVRHERRQLRKAELLLRDLPTEELEFRATNWPYLTKYAHTDAVREVRALLAARRYDELRAHWRRHSGALSALGEEPSPAKPEYVDSGSSIMLDAFVRELSRRQRADGAG